MHIILGHNNEQSRSFSFLDSERSDECIDFTMIITSRNNASISNFWGGFRWKIKFSKNFDFFRIPHEFCKYLKILPTTEIFNFSEKNKKNSYR
ncbi:Uncharacterized protein FWK35_00018754 [Aphis craccivora]|uniref:Uncharacterized protein n=1 Tax=Aphis craccivora TaxID=307492 RepID=A0A6G0YN73_APHCR|nr:Uncharacterized protein FWK35_00018754 [Aphis craccivora]